MICSLGHYRARCAVSLRGSVEQIFEPGVERILVGGACILLADASPNFHSVPLVEHVLIDERLKAAALAASAQSACRIDRHMAELTGQPVGSTIQLATDVQPDAHVGEYILVAPDKSRRHPHPDSSERAQRRPSEVSHRICHELGKFLELHSSRSPESRRLQHFIFQICKKQVRAVVGNIHSDRERQRGGEVVHVRILPECSGSVPLCSPCLHQQTVLLKTSHHLDYRCPTHSAP